MRINIGVSNRHVHLTQDDFNLLFGDDQELEVNRYLTQPGEFASNSFVTLKTDKSSMENVRVLGPLRSYTQIEIAKTDAYKLGINPPVRESGDIVGSEGITIIGPKGQIEKTEGCIIASRHIHVTSEDAKKHGFDEQKNISNVDVFGMGNRACIPPANCFTKLSGKALTGANAI